MYQENMKLRPFADMSADILVRKLIGRKGIIEEGQPFQQEIIHFPRVKIIRKSANGRIGEKLHNVQNICTYEAHILELEVSVT
jgi:hypothetical protein